MRIYLGPPLVALAFGCVDAATSNSAAFDNTSDGTFDCVVAGATDFDYHVAPADCPLNANHVAGTCSESGATPCGEAEPGTGLACCPLDHPFRCGSYCTATNECGQYCVRCSGSATPFDVKAAAKDIGPRMRCTMFLANRDPYAGPEVLFSGKIELTMNGKPLVEEIRFRVTSAGASNPDLGIGSLGGFVEVSGSVDRRSASLTLDMKSLGGVPVGGEKISKLGIKGLENVAPGDNGLMSGAIQIVATASAFHGDAGR